MSFENYIVNPLNNRLIRKGLTLHRKLIKEGIIIHDFENDPSILCEIDVDSDLESLKQTYDDQLQGYHAVRGRGMYDRYLVKKKKRSKKEDKSDQKLKHLVKQVHKKIIQDEITDVATLERTCIQNANNKYGNYGKNKYYIEL